MSYAFLNSNGETGLGDFWEDINKGIEVFIKGKEALGVGKGTTIPISQVIVEPPPSYDPYAPKSFDIGSLLIPAVVVVGGGLLMFFLIKAMKKK